MSRAIAAEGAAHPEHAGRPGLPALTGLRAVAAVWVVLFHFRGELQSLVPSLHLLDGFMRAGYLGVDLFFPLSGFVLAYNYADAMRTWSWTATLDFVRNRVARVWPVHLVTLHIDLAIAASVGSLGIGDGGLRRTLSAYLQNLFMVQYWFNDRPSFNSPAWTISAEWMAYLAAPLLFLLFARVRRAGTALAGAGLAYGVMLAIFAVYALPNGNLEHLPYVRIGGEFIGGALLALAWLRGGWRAPRLAGPLAAIVIIGTGLTPRFAGGDYWAAPLLGLLVFALGTGPSLLGNVLRRPAVVLAGEASYCLYMTHWLLRDVVAWLADWGDGAWWSALTALVTIVVVLAAAAWGLHVLVERPARRLLRAPRHG